MKRLVCLITVLLLVFSVTAVFAEDWVCPNCGNTASGNFCNNCGTAKPSTDWICSNCGSIASGNFCSNCGAPRPSDAPSSNTRTEADRLRAQGKLVEAEALYATLPQDEEIVSIRKDLYYESRVLHCALQVRESLLFPETFILRDAYVDKTPDFCYDRHTNISSSVASQPDVILRFSTQTNGGNIVSKYIVCTGNIRGYSIGYFMDSLGDDKTPDNLSLDEQYDFASQSLKLYWLSVYPSDFRILTNTQVARLNSIIAETIEPDVGFVDFNDLMPRPTPTPTPIPTPTSTPTPTPLPTPIPSPTPDISGLFDTWEVPQSTDYIALHDDKTYVFYINEYETHGTWKVDNDFVVLTRKLREGMEPVDDVYLAIGSDEAGETILILAVEGVQDYVFYRTVIK